VTRGGRGAEPSPPAPRDVGLGPAGPSGLARRSGRTTAAHGTAVLLVVVLVGSATGVSSSGVSSPALARIDTQDLLELGREIGAEASGTSLFGRRAVRLPATEVGRALRLPGTLPWPRARYLVADAMADGELSGEVLVRFFGHAEKEPRLSVSLGLFPGLPARLALPLRVLDGQTIFLPRTPGRMKAVVTGRRLAPADVDHVELQLKLTAAPQSLYLGAVSLTTSEPSYPVPARPLVDELGQWVGKSWPGKTADDAQLGTDLAVALEKTREAEFPSSWSRFGGTRARTFAATGYFRTENDGKRWWLVDPEGYGFFSLGLDSVRPGETAAVVPGTEPLFSPLPPARGPLGEAWFARSGRGRPRTFSFGLANLIRSYGPRWREEWTTLTRGRLKQWRFNTVANWSDPQFLRTSGLPYVVPMPDYPTTAERLYRDFPDVFAAGFRDDARRYAGALRPLRDDRNLVGYFMRNEPHWAFGPNNLASEMLEAHPGSATRAALVKWLRARYHDDAAAWAAAWGLGLSRFDELETALVPRAADRSPRASEDLWEFSKEMVRAYVRVPAEECRKVDPNHLNLGMRYAWISSDLLYESAGSFDVFTINAYQMLPPADAIAEIARRTGKPVLIGEFHFGALDRGLPSTGLRAVASQEERGVAYRRYVEAAAADPNVVGTHYFILNDQEVLGRFDGENFQIGFVDVCQHPYRELVEAARRTHESVYEIMQGQLNPYARDAREIPRVGF
jgi:hypothetical protein